jgi:peptidoglycan-associated lipoprotein
MRQQLKKSLFICLAAALGCAGCAKQEMVRQDQALPGVSPLVAPAGAALPAQAAPPAVQRPAPADTVLSSSTIADAPAEGQARQAGKTEPGTDATLQTSLDKVFFDFDSHTLSPAARATLAKNADILKKKSGLKLRIEGNCDETGSDKYNLALGENRAKSAKDYLVSLGIHPDRLAIISYGKEKPAEPGHDEAAKAKNRRDEFVVTTR